MKKVKCNMAYKCSHAKECPHSKPHIMEYYCKLPCRAAGDNGKHKCVKVVERNG